jgi:hypothetical protein
LKLAIKTVLSNFKTGNISSIDADQIINNELTCSEFLLSRIEFIIATGYKDYREGCEEGVPEYILEPVSNKDLGDDFPVVELRAVAGEPRIVYAKPAPYTEYKEKHGLNILYTPALNEYRNFLKDIYDNFNDFIGASDYWDMRNNRLLEISQTRTEPAPDSQPPEQDAPKEAGSLTKPPFKCIDELILEGYLADDGRRVLVNLNDVAVRLYKEVVVTKKLLNAYFVKDDGGKYSGSALRDAVNAAHVKPYIKLT